MKLYFDIGNTNIKLNFIDNNLNNYISFVTNFSHTVDSFYNELPEIVKKKKIKKIFICSVVPKLTPLFEGLSKKYFNLKPKIIGLPLKSGILLKVDDPKIVGSDLVSLGAYANYISNNTIIVNLGTTTTIIHVKNKVFNGAVIMPGLKLQLNAVLEKVAKIADMEIEYKQREMGANTKDALSIGIINSHIFAINKHIENIDDKAKVIISGGNAKIITSKVNYEYVKEATIEGMKIIEALNEK